jgi:ABC-type transport system involved in multi-copper enzyme maturation permease subunit
MTVPTALESVLTIAGLTLRRLLRGRALWVSAVIAAMPVLFALVMRGYAQWGTLADDLLVFEMLALAVLPPMFVAGAIGDEIEDRTITYLWSRPVPRWTMLAGKLVALAPAASALMVSSWFVALMIGTEEAPLRSLLGVGLGALGGCLIATGISTLVPKHGMALSVSYMLFFDLPVGALPASVQYLSITQQVRVIVNFDGTWVQSTAGAVVALLAIGGVWLAIGVLRVRRLEA